jgi:phosphatidylserine/phosphatidylglycerophosphate/cardiolipin synthase-like enzyme
MRKLFLLCGIFIFWSTLCLADTFTREASYSVCFSPEGHCTKTVVNSISKAKKEILVQAFSFTSFPIAKALVTAREHGVDVKVILDKSTLTDQFYAVQYCQKHKLPLKIDYLPAVAHNKVMIIDNELIITGSFNFTKAADEKNTENLLVIHDKILAKKYKDNWDKRESSSINISEYLPQMLAKPRPDH